MTTLQHSLDGADRTATAMPAPGPVVRRVTRRAFGIVAMWMERSRQRRALADLDDHLLKDIGITRSEAAREAAQPFWA